MMFDSFCCLITDMDTQGDTSLNLMRLRNQQHCSGSAEQCSTRILERILQQFKVLCHDADVGWRSLWCWF
jgi:hypothetical protein